MKKIIVILLSILLITSTAMAQTSNEPSDWAKTKVEKIQQLGISILGTNGYTDNISRQEFSNLVVVLCEKILGNELEIPTVNPFVDTNDTYILKAYNAGIVEGIDSTHFLPDTNITREQIVVMYINALKMIEEQTNRDLISDLVTTSFADETTFSSWAEESINIANTNGIITGVGNNTFNPSGFATREQALVIGLRSYYLTKDVSDVIDKANDYYKDSVGFSMNGNVYVDMMIEEQDVPMDMELDLDFDVKELINPIKAKILMDGSIKVGYYGTEMEVPMTMEEYIVQEKDEIITYMVIEDPYTGEKTYQKVVIPFVDSDYLTNLEQMNNITNFDSFGRYTLIDEEVVDGNTIYTVAMTINMDESTVELIEGLVGDMSSQFGLESNVLSMMNGLQFIYQFDAETGKILTIESDLGDYLEQLISSLSELDGYGFEDINLTIDAFKFKVNFDSSSDMEVIIPQEVIDKAIDMTELLEPTEVTEDINNEL